jgi:hypothetical protein
VDLFDPKEMNEETWLLPWTPDSDAELRFRITLALLDKYMTTGTATTQATIDLDAANDAKRLKAAVDAVIETLK